MSDLDDVRRYNWGYACEEFIDEQYQGYISAYNGHLILLTQKHDWIVAEPCEPDWVITGPRFATIEEAHRFIDLTPEEAWQWFRAGKPPLVSDAPTEPGGLAPEWTFF